MSGESKILGCLLWTRSELSSETHPGHNRHCRSLNTAHHPVTLPNLLDITSYVFYRYFQRHPQERSPPERLLRESLARRDIQHPETEARIHPPKRGEHCKPHHCEGQAVEKR